MLNPGMLVALSVAVSVAASAAMDPAAAQTTNLASTTQYWKPLAGKPVLRPAFQSQRSSPRAAKGFKPIHRLELMYKF
jgi:hypothetical protein